VRPFPLPSLSYPGRARATHRRIRLTTETSVYPTARSDLRDALERLHADCAGWALSCCAFDRSEADDVLQTSYLKVLDGRAAYHGRSSFKTWLFGVIRRTAAEQRRRRAVSRLLFGQALDGVAQQPAPLDEGLTAAEDAARLARALRGLPRRQREVLHLVFYQELTIEESAQVLAISLGSARTHYERGKKRLRSLLAGGNEQ
jgi:RNA polymerase sigma-70 factor (ECF subfamily)